MVDVQQVGANWISVIPFGYSYKGKTFVRYNLSKYQWWGEKPEGVRKTIQLAKESGIGILLKPQVYVPGSWPGGIQFDNEKDWEKWEKEYSEYILTFAKIAQEEKVDIFCIGTEFKQALQERPAFWISLIKEIRSIYSGPLTYAANWDEFFTIPVSFWKKLDFAGLDAYFPLSEEGTPAVKDLKEAWIPIKHRIAEVAKKIKIPVIFTEYGYLSVDGCAGNSWELEQVIDKLSINQQAQANAIEALMQTFWKEDWWAGGFIWKWFPKMQGHEGYPDKDYTPQGKLSLTILKLWFSKR